MSLEIVIVGAGLGGLATAISLAQRRHQVRVLEQAKELGEVFMEYLNDDAGQHTDTSRSELASRSRPIHLAYCTNSA